MTDRKGAVLLHFLQCAFQILCLCRRNYAGEQKRPPQRPRLRSSLRLISSTRLRLDYTTGCGHDGRIPRRAPREEITDGLHCWRLSPAIKPDLSQKCAPSSVIHKYVRSVTT